ncbi:MAG: terminase family protein [Sphingomonas bacterium]|nr:terminase family protein [Sphingomonas bacterium]
MADEAVRLALSGLPLVERRRALACLSREEAEAFDGDWPSWAHDGQAAPPACADGREWRTWVMIAGRGFGKTRAGAEWIAGRVQAAVREGAQGREGRGEGGGALNIALVGATIDDARRVMVEGRSGLLRVAAGLIEAWHPSRRLLRFVGGSEATLFSGASPEALRGPEHSHAWCDELAKWEQPQAAWDMLQLGLRVGRRPRALITTTPRAGPLLGRIMAEADTVVSGGATRANPHLPAAFVRAVEGLYRGTRLGEQELDGVYRAELAGQLWTVEMIEACRVEPDRSPFEEELRIVRPGQQLQQMRVAPERPRRRFEQIAIGVDPPSGGGTCGIVACARDSDGHGHVLGDHSVSGVSPEGWARAVAAAAALYPDPVIVAEANQGGHMVRSVLRAASGGAGGEAGASLRIKLVHAKDSKTARAEPVALLFDQRRVSVHGRFPELEAELCGLVSGEPYAGPGKSPDRADAMVWALGEVMLRGGVVRVSAL